MATREKKTFEDARLIFKNFQGKGNDYNVEGDRNFCIVLTDDEASELKDLGYNVKTRLPREGHEDDGPLHFLKVKLSYRYGDDRDPSVYRICGNSRTMYTEKTIGSLDWEEIETVDLRIRPWNWNKGGRSGVTAILDSMYVTVKEDPLAAKYGSPVDDYEPDDVPFD